MIIILSIILVPIKGTMIIVVTCGDGNKDCGNDLDSFHFYLAVAQLNGMPVLVFSCSEPPVVVDFSLTLSAFGITCFQRRLTGEGRPTLSLGSTIS